MQTIYIAQIYIGNFFHNIGQQGGLSDQKETVSNFIFVLISSSIFLYSNLFCFVFETDKTNSLILKWCFVWLRLILKKITYTIEKYCYFSLMGKIGLPRVRSVDFRKAMEMVLTSLCTLTIGFGQGTSCLFNPTARCTPSHALHTH